MTDKNSRWEHPLIRTLDRPVSRRSVIAGAIGLSVAPALRIVSAQETPAAATPETEIEGDSDAVALLQSAVTAVAALDTFRFDLKTTRGSSTIFQGLDLKGVTGAVRRPMDIEATVTVSLPFGEISVTAIGLDGEFWVQDPLTSGSWISLGGNSQVQALINPDQLLLYAVRLVHDAKITGTEKVDGVDTTVVEGTVDFYDTLQRLLSGTDAGATIEQGLAQGAKDVTFWIDDQNRVVEAEIRGPIFSTESDDVVRDLSLYDFDQPVDIERPANVQS
ncbi:MAG TPA: LppX_LprAFG lipoprotein [Thermomicrobiales bacterium]|nr:LppX_LprAFG lipoprotein [Thermomicrobiales bacterium]